MEIRNIRKNKYRYTKRLNKKGYNKVEIKAYKTISDKVCRDDSNTANWLVIHKE
ncbi:putative cell wall anchored domain protein [[Clostridium] sordellii ATCC 9714]|nr:putative cell wall anchored domain protein [[Clostridium] sordellii ATCC 9714] [Paeniclostridium sordellii ATCC 9714]